jgi:hypothetical protein
MDLEEWEHLYLAEALLVLKRGRRIRVGHCLSKALCPELLTTLKFDFLMKHLILIGIWSDLSCQTICPYVYSPSFFFVSHHYHLDIFSCLHLKI